MFQLPRSLASLATALAPIAVTPLLGCAGLQELAQLPGGGSAEPTTTEIVGGLRQALSKGASQAVAELAREGGYREDPAVRIPFPEEAKFAADALRKVGLGSLVDEFEQRLNRGAEAGAARALPIFEGAIRAMSFADVRAVLFGGEHAATDYFRTHAFDSLVAAFRPEIAAALDGVGAVELWTELSKRYNQVPLTSKKVDTDIVHYATQRALEGLFTRVASEEARIRENPVARTTALMQEVFAYARRTESRE